MLGIAPDGSGNPGVQKAIFFLIMHSDRRKLVQDFRKKSFLNEELKRTAGLGPKNINDQHHQHERDRL